MTHTAEVAVKAASSTEVVRPDWLETGSISNTVPAEMTARNPDTTYRAGWSSNDRRPVGVPATATA